MFAQRLRERFPDVPITEAHPGALQRAMGLREWPRFCERFRIEGNSASAHERDAVIAAISAREGFEGRWPRDLSKDRLPSEQDPMAYWLAPMHYFWPE